MSRKWSWPITGLLFIPDLSRESLMIRACFLHCRSNIALHFNFDTLKELWPGCMKGLHRCIVWEWCVENVIALAFLTLNIINVNELNNSQFLINILCAWNVSQYFCSVVYWCHEALVVAWCDRPATQAGTGTSRNLTQGWYSWPIRTPSVWCVVCTAAGGMETRSECDRCAYNHSTCDQDGRATSIAKIFCKQFFWIFSCYNEWLLIMVLGGIWNFIKRHRRKVFFAGAVVGGEK